MALDPQERRSKRFGAAVCLAILLASFVYSPAYEHGPVLCPLRLVTGIPCPGCGLTRSFCAVADGRFRDAFAHHLFGPFAFAGVTLVGALWALEAATGRKIVVLERLAFSSFLAWSMAGTLLAYYAVRMAMWAHSGELAAGIKASLGGQAMARLFH